MEKIISEKKEDIFISYRRKGGEWFAYVIYLKLTDLGYSCFFDKESLRGGTFTEAIKEHVESCQDFILILPPYALDRCVEAEDLVYEEILTAQKNEKNIIPIFLNDFFIPALRLFQENDQTERYEQLFCGKNAITKKNGTEANSIMDLDKVLVRLQQKLLKSVPSCVNMRSADVMTLDTFLGLAKMHESSDEWSQLKEGMASYSSNVMEQKTKREDGEEFPDNIDEKLAKRFAEIFEDTDKKEDGVSKLAKIKADRFWKTLSDGFDKFEEQTEEDDSDQEEQQLSLIPLSYKKGTPLESTMQLVIPDVPGYKTIVLKICSKCDYKTMTHYYVPEQLQTVPKSEEDNIGQTTYVVDDIDINGQPIFLLHFNAEKGDVFINFGVMDGTTFRMTKATQQMHFERISFSDELCLNEAAYDLAQASDAVAAMKNDQKINTGKNEQQYFSANVGEDVSIMIDPETASIVRREMYYDEGEHRLKARIPIRPNTKFFAVHLDANTKESNGDREFAINFANGLNGFPKDLESAIEYFEKEGSAYSLYRIALLFAENEDIYDETIYDEYLNRAMEQKYWRAYVEDSLHQLFSHPEEEIDPEELKLTRIIGEEGLRWFLLGYFIEKGILKGTKVEAFAYYCHSVEKNFKASMIRLGSYDTAIEDVDSFWDQYYDYTRSARYDDGTADYCMGCVLFFGWNFDPHKVQGIKLLNKAAEMGHVSAAKALYCIYKNDPEYKNEALAAKWEKKI